MNLPTDVDAYYVARGGDRYQPTIHAQGAWRDIEQHMAPVSGLLVHAIESHDPREDLQLGRVSFDILGIIHAEETTVETRTLRPGRTIELVEATASTQGRPVVRARAWRLARQDTSAVAALEDEPMPHPEEVPPWQDMEEVWSGGYISSLEFRAVPGRRPGRGRAWLRSPLGLVAGEACSETARFVGLVDTANGIATRQDPRRWLYPNTDLTIHLYRQPTAGWVGLDTSVTWGSSGVGVTSTVLHDVHGPVGRAQQVLTVRPMPEGAAATATGAARAGESR
ncbi:thioesterase family protein [Ornithinicoccus halotolerans]|uniref:thioesterase family protein n=1 Tax=Ornithinicoccus halotolerans TaxID=1748220 RepID=UPI001297A740|nr:thioesterase family protein [Ornithinicoccus halotolerans]